MTSKTKACPNCKGVGHYTVKEIRNRFGCGKYEHFYEEGCPDCDGEGVVELTQDELDELAEAEVNHDVFCPTVKDPGRQCECGAEERSES